jgi:hypothetical protein
MLLKITKLWDLRLPLLRNIVNKESRREGRLVDYVFDGAVNVYGNGASAVIISPNKKQYPVSVKLHFECTNNTAKHEACMIGLEAALELKIR